MLGSVAEAEDVVQEAQLRLHQRKRPPDSDEAFLFRVTTNLCLDRLRKEKVRRKAYLGPWLPDPVVAEDQTVELAEELSIGFMRLLETLTPAERVSYVLREGFDYSFADIASVLEISEANARQRAARARKRLMGSEDFERHTPDDEQRALLEALLAAVANRDTDALVDLMSENAVVYTDGGGVVSAAVRPVTGPRRIAQVTLHLAQKAAAQEPLVTEFARVNGGWGLLMLQGGAVHSVIQVEGADGKVERVYVVRNPNKLAHLKLTHQEGGTK